jgi:hypothetical protein
MRIGRKARIQGRQDTQKLYALQVSDRGDALDSLCGRKRNKDLVACHSGLCKFQTVLRYGRALTRECRRQGFFHYAVNNA